MAPVLTNTSILKSTNICKPYYPTWGSPEKFAEFILDESDKPNWLPGQAEVAEAWKERHDTWNQYRRDWYDVEHARWSATPVSGKNTILVGKHSCRARYELTFVLPGSGHTLAFATLSTCSK